MLKTKHLCGVEGDHLVDRIRVEANIRVHITDFVEQVACRSDRRVATERDSLDGGE